MAFTATLCGLPGHPNADARSITAFSIEEVDPINCLGILPPADPLVKRRYDSKRLERLRRIIAARKH